MAVDVLTELVFLRKESKHSTEKPYKLQYDPGEGLPRSNCINEATTNITIRDIRGRENQFTLEREGFSYRHMKSSLAPEEFYHEERVKKVYYLELQHLLMETLGAKRVEILEHGIRKTHPNFPISTGKEYDYLQPTSVVHIDFTSSAALAASRQGLCIDPENYSRVQCINIWKPLHGPLTNWPLALCDAQTVNLEEDCIATDVVTRTGWTENYQIYPNPRHQWYYLNKQEADEVAIFRQCDTDETFATGVPHAGFRNPKAIPGEKLRESIEARALVYY